VRTSPDRSLDGLNERSRERDRKAQRRNVVGLGLFVAGLAAIPLIDVVRTAIAAKAEEREWQIAGPACPVVAKPSKAAMSRRGVMTHRYGDVTFARSFAAVSCAAFPEPGWRWKRRVYRVCQFNNPGAVTVTTARGRTMFEATPGRPITITVRDGRATCVVGGWFR
jgi:hypothetical protein